MIKIKILSVGKTKEAWLEEAFQEYVKRLSPFAQIELAWTKDDRQLVDKLKKEPHPLYLDPAGKLLTSEGFSRLLFDLLQKEGARLTIVIGGAEGLPEEIKKGQPLVSLSPLTFTHQITRLIAIEQIYRAFEIEKGSHYHK